MDLEYVGKRPPHTSFSPPASSSKMWESVRRRKEKFNVYSHRLLFYIGQFHCSYRMLFNILRDIIGVLEKELWSATRRP